ncbi:MAG: translocation/assembly module TamB domain-containing protein [Burkholderiaceae bacterium]
MSAPEVPAPVGRPPGVWRWVLKAALPLVLMLALLLGLAATIRSEWALRWLVERGVEASHGQLEIEGISGSLFREISLQQLRWTDARQQIDAGPLVLRLSWPGLLDPMLRIRELSIGEVRWKHHAQAPPSAWPVSLQPPVDLLVERLAVDGVTLVMPDLGLQLQARQLQMSLGHERQAWHLAVLSMQTLSVSGPGESAGANRAASAPALPESVWVGPQGWVSGLQMQATLGSQAPHEIQARIQATPGHRGDPWMARLTRLGLTSSTGLLMQVAGTIEAPSWTLEVPGRPMQTRIEGRGLQAGRLILTNALAGPLSAGALPMSRLEGQWRLEGQRLWFDAMKLDGPAGSARLDGWLDLDATKGKEENETGTNKGRGKDQFELAISSAALDLSGLTTGLHPTALQTKLRLRGDLARWRLAVEGRDPAREVSLRAQLEFSGRLARIDQMMLQGQEGSAQFRGELEFGHDLFRSPGLKGSATKILQDSRIRLDGRFDRLNPARWIGSGPAWPISGPFTLLRRPDGPVVLDARLQWGPARIRVESGPGGAGAVKGEVRARVEGIPAAQLWPGSGGLLDAELALSGPWPLMTASLRLRAREALMLVQGSAVSARSAIVELTLDDLQSALKQWRGSAAERSTGFRASLTASGLAWQERRVRSLQIVLDGRSAGAGTQEGVLQAFEVDIDKGRFALREPVAIRRNEHALSLSPSHWQFGFGKDRPAGLALEQIDWTQGGAKLLARIDALPMSALASLLEPWLAAGAIETGGAEALLMRARMELHLPESLRLSELQGRLDLDRQSGDLKITLPDVGQPIQAGLTKTELSVQLSGGDLALQWLLEGRLLGRVRGEARSNGILVDAGLDRQALLQGRMQLDLPSLEMARLFTGPVWQIDGALQADLRLGGTVGTPSLSGAITGRDLVALQQAVGMRLDRGVLRASLLDNRIDIEQLSFQSAQGRVLMTGVLRSDESSEARIVLERLPIPLGAGQRLLLSGEARARLGRDGLVLTGQLQADEGVIEISSASTPTLAADIRVRPAGAPAVKPGMGNAAERTSFDRSGTGVTGPASAPRGPRLQGRAAGRSG